MKSSHVCLFHNSAGFEQLQSTHVEKRINALISLSKIYFLFCKINVDVVFFYEYSL